VNHPIIEVIVSPNGEATLQTKGFSGSSCREASKALEQALGIVESDAPTAELHQTALAQEPLRQR
jgi:Protein of unknown function (DUF2997)